MLYLFFVECITLRGTQHVGKFTGVTETPVNYYHLAQQAICYKTPVNYYHLAQQAALQLI
jgi:hypothetical protein